jgi:hypothetical protein
MAKGSRSFSAALALAIGFLGCSSCSRRRSGEQQSSGPARDRIISEGTARKLAQEALVALGGDWPSANIESYDNYWAPEFYAFMAYYPGPESAGGASVLQTYYLAVNPWTGDVWDVAECSLITSPAIAKAQESIWSRSGLRADAHLPLHDKSPASCSLIEGKASEKK